MKSILTGFCCGMLIKDKGKAFVVASYLDKCIKENRYEDIKLYIDKLDIDIQSKDRLLKCALSYKFVC